MLWTSGCFWRMGLTPVFERQGPGRAGTGKLGQVQCDFVRSQTRDKELNEAPIGI